jgi:hypothetical protein
MSEQKVEEALVKIRQSSVFRNLVPMQAGTGWPVPIRKRGKMYLCIPYFGLQQGKGKQPVLIYPPFATITVSWPKLLIVEYVNLRWRNLWSEKQLANPAGIFPHPAVAGVKLEEYNDMRQRLMAYIEAMLNSTIDKTGLQEFSKIFHVMMEPSLLPYYRKLFPKYYGHFLPAKTAS